MAVSKNKIIKWMRMLSGNSISHVNQGEGKCYSTTDLCGYYNDLTEKVTRRISDEGIAVNAVPLSETDQGEKIFFPIEIFQYGLGAYDLFLMNGDDSMYQRAKNCADWAVKDQNNDGSWNTFFFKHPQNPYSSMAQGEGISLLVRIYKQTKSPIYLDAASKALDFMMLPLDKGGTTLYVGNSVYLYEYTHLPLVLNGWIFSLWGLLDYTKVNSNTIYKNIYYQTVQTLKRELYNFDLGYWSKYNNKNMITSPFYHKLHIAQLEVMYALTNEPEFEYMAQKWTEYQNRLTNRLYAFGKKAFQKIKE